MKKNAQHIFILLCLLLGAKVGCAQEQFSISIKATPQDITIGDHVKVTVKVTHLPSVSTTFPVPEQYVDSPFIILEKGKIDTAVTPQFITLTQELKVTSYDSGLHKIPVLLTTIGSNYVGVASDSTLVRIRSVVVNMGGDIKDIEDAKAMPLWLRVIILAGIVILIIALVFAIGKYVSNKNLKAQTRKNNPYHYALERLQQAEKLLDKEQQHKEAYTLITHAIKYFAQHRLGLPLLATTSNTSLALLQQHHLCYADTASLTEILNQADEIKFANAASNIFTTKQHCNNAKEMIVRWQHAWQAEQAQLEQAAKSKQNTTTTKRA